MISAFSIMQKNSLTHNSDFRHKLKEIVENIQIASDLTITCQGYEPLEVTSDIQEYLKQVPLLERNQYLAAKLQSYLYNIFSFDPKSETNSNLETIDDTESEDLDDGQAMTNYVKKWSRTNFYQKLTQSNHGLGYSDPNWLVIKQEANGWQITKNDLTLHIQPEMHLVKPLEVVHPGQYIAIKMPSNLVDRGKYIAVGDAGSMKAADSSQTLTIAQLYFNVSAEGAIFLVDNLTQKLNTIKIPFELNVTYDEEEFDNFDDAVLDFQSDDFNQAYPIVRTIYNEGQSYFKPELPFFCKCLASGLGLAEKPRSQNFEQENIGQHYSGIIAKALVESWQRDHQLCTDRLDFILQYVSKVGVDLDHLYLNPDSIDIYETNFV